MVAGNGPATSSRPGNGQDPRDALGGQCAHDVVDLGLAAHRPGRKVGDGDETGLVDPAGAGHGAVEAGVGEPGDEDGGARREDAVEGWQLVELAWRDLDAEVGHELAHPLLERTRGRSRRLAGRHRVDTHRSPHRYDGRPHAPAPRWSSTSSAGRNSSVETDRSVSFVPMSRPGDADPEEGGAVRG
jgi:hypothetical protein